MKTRMMRITRCHEVRADGSTCAGWANSSGKCPDHSVRWNRGGGSITKRQAAREVSDEADAALRRERLAERGR